MITLINKTKHLKTYELECSIPKHGAQKSDMKLGKKTLKGVKKETERVLTMMAGERRVNLPDAVAESKLVKRAIEKGELLMKRQKVVSAKVEEKQEKAKTSGRRSSGSAQES